MYTYMRMCNLIYILIIFKDLHISDRLPAMPRVEELIFVQIVGS